ncbi:MAG: DUF2523 domain-containing protein [Cocleimonas sp.]
MNFIGILTWLMGSIGSRILLSLGMGFISYGAITVAATALITQFADLWQGLPSAVLSILSLAGFPTAFGWIIGAYLAKLTLNSLSKIGKIPTG